MGFTRALDPHGRVQVRLHSFGRAYPMSSSPDTVPSSAVPVFLTSASLLAIQAASVFAFFGTEAATD